MPLAAALTSASAVAPRLTPRWGRRTSLVAALTVLAGGLCWLAAGTAAQAGFAGGLLGPSVLIGAGLGTAFVQLTDASADGVGGADAGLAGGLINTTRQIGGAVGLAALTTVTTSTAGGSGTAALADGHAAAFLGCALLAALAALIAGTALPGGPAKR